MSNKRDALQLRSRAAQAIRSFFYRRNYLEVHTPLRVRVPGLEIHIEAEPSGERYLITSPEFHMKRLLSEGFERIFSLGPVWRRGERGEMHLPEFYMLEWYCAHATTNDLMDETELLIRDVATQTMGCAQLHYREHRFDLEKPFLRISVDELFQRFVGFSLKECADAETFRTYAHAKGYDVDEDEEYDVLFSRLWVDRIDPALASMSEPVFVTHFPSKLAALAQLHPKDPACADRFELYIGGVELANAFGELLDASEQRRRFMEEQDQRRRRGLACYSLDERFLAALKQGIPPTSGIALGFDRLVMLLCNAASINDVVAFAPEEV